MGGIFDWLRQSRRPERFLKDQERDATALRSGAGSTNFVSAVWGRSSSQPGKARAHYGG